MCIALLVVIASMFLIWKPWQGAKPSGRQVTVSGEAKAKHAPDEYVFSPNAEATSDESNKAALDLATKKGNDIIAKLKEMGVTDDQLVVNVNSYGSKAGEIAPVPARSSGYMATYSITCTVGDKALAQKVADYLATADVGGSVTPYAQFASETRKKIEQELRSAAIEDARGKAKAEAQLLGVKLGKLISVSDNTNGGVIPYGTGASDLKIAEDSATPPVLVGTQEVAFTVQVVFEIK